MLRYYMCVVYVYNINLRYHHGKAKLNCFEHWMQGRFNRNTITRIRIRIHINGLFVSLVKIHTAVCTHNVKIIFPLNFFSFEFFFCYYMVNLFNVFYYFFFLILFFFLLLVSQNKFSRYFFIFCV